MVLQIALIDHNVDGLTPSEITRILTEKFRIRTMRTSVSKALGIATTLVNRIPQDRGFLYKIMGSGQEYLARLGEAAGSPAASAQRRKPRKKRILKEVKNVSSTKGHTSEEKAYKIKKQNKRLTKNTDRKTFRKSSTGPKGAILNLIESGFFTKARTGPEVQAHLKNKRGFNFGTNQLRLAMLRLVREEKLERDQNAEGQYEYKRSKA